MTARLYPDPLVVAACGQMAVPFVPMPKRPPPERLVPPPREHAPTPTCHEGGPHRYPPGRSTVCDDCGATPAANAAAGLRRAESEHALAEAFR